MKTLGLFAAILVLAAICLPAAAQVNYISGAVYNNTVISGIVAVEYGHGMPGASWTPLQITTITVDAGLSGTYIFNNVTYAPDYCVLAVLDSNGDKVFDPSTGDPAAIGIYPVLMTGVPADIYIGGQPTPGKISGTVTNQTNVSGSVIVYYGQGVPGPNWAPTGYSAVFPLNIGETKPYNFDNVPDAADYSVLAILDANKDGKFDPNTGDLAAMGPFPVEVYQAPHPNVNIVIAGQTTPPTQASLSGTVYNDTSYDGAVTVYYGQRMPGKDWNVVGFTTATVKASGSCAYSFKNVPEYQRYCVAAVLDKNANGVFDPSEGDPSGLKYPIAVLGNSAAVIGQAVHINENVFGSVSGTVYNDTMMSGNMQLVAGYDFPDRYYWVPVSTQAFYLSPGMYRSYTIDNLFNGADVTIAAVLDTNWDGMADPWDGAPAGLNFPVRVNNAVSGVDVHVSSTALGSISGKVTNNTNYPGAVGVMFGAGQPGPTWMPVDMTSMSVSVPPGGYVAYSFPTVFKYSDYAVAAILDVDGLGDFNPVKGDVVGYTYPVAVNGAVSGKDITLGGFKISGTIKPDQVVTVNNTTTNTNSLSNSTGGNTVTAPPVVNTGLIGVRVVLSGQKDAVVVTNSSGYYEFPNLQPGEYTITPAKLGWAFTPAAVTTVILSDLPSQDFTGHFNTTTEIKQISVPIGGGSTGDTPVNVTLPDAGGSKLIMPEESKDRRGALDPKKGDSVAIVFNSQKTAAEVLGQPFTIRVFNSLGKLVYETTKIPTSPDDTWMKWVPDMNLASGIYIIHVKGPGVNIHKRIPIIK